MGLANHHTWIEVVNNTTSKVKVKSEARGNGWDKDARPDKNFNGKDIYSNNRHTEEEKIESNKKQDSLFTMTFEVEDGNNTNIILPETNMRNSLEIDGNEENLIYSSKLYDVTRTIGEKVKIQKKQDGKETTEHACRFTIKKSEQSKESLRFVVISDTHFRNNKKDKDIESYINDFASSMGDLKPKPEFLVICGDLTNDNNGGYMDYSQQTWLDRFINKIEKEVGITVYEGFGNHDLNDINTGANIAGYVEKRNKERAKKGCNEFEYSNHDDDDFPNSPFHYTWKMYVRGVGIRFFMLNNVPGYGEILSEAWEKGESDKIYKEEKYERDPKGSLNYLERILIDKNNDIYGTTFVNTFFHINFDSGDEGERWWQDSSKKDYVSVVKDCKLLPSFFGHKHSGTGPNQTVEEQLLNSGIYGYRCRCTGGRGAKYYNLVELSIENDSEKGDILNYKITPKDVDKDEKNKNTLYLLPHHGIALTGSSYDSVTLRFLLNGEQLDRKTNQ